MNGVLECAPHLVVLLVLFELLLFLFQGGQPVLDGLEELFNLFLLGVGLLKDALGLPPPLVVDPRSRHLAQQLEALRVRRRRHLVDLALLDDVVGVGARKPGRLQQVHHLGPRDHLLVEKVIVFLRTDHPSQKHLRGTKENGHTIIELASFFFTAPHIM